MGGVDNFGGGVVRSGNRATLGGFLKRAQRTLLDTPWQIVQIMETGTPGLFRLWALVGSDLHQIKLVVPRVFYVNQRTAKEAPAAGSDTLWRKITKTLPRSHPVMNLYEYRVPEAVYKEHTSDLVTDLSTPDVEGIYETQVPLEFRSLVELGCLCMVKKEKVRELAANNETDTFDLDWLQMKHLSSYHYMAPSAYKTLYFYHHRVGHKQLVGLFVPTNKKAHVYVVDTVRTNQMPNLTSLYNNERTALEGQVEKLPEESYTFEVRVETDLRQVFRQMGRVLTAYKDERRGPTVIAVQSLMDFQVWALTQLFSLFFL